MLLDYQLKDADSGCLVLQQGIILNNMFQLFGIEWQEKSGWEQYPEFDTLDIAGNFDGETYLWRGAYGVCDSKENLLEVYPELVADGRTFVVNLCRIDKDEQPDEGGWRWHKWGDYIGNQTPTTEYIYHEPLIERVYCYHIYEKKA